MMKRLKVFCLITLITASGSLFLNCPPEVLDETAPNVVILYPVSRQVVSGQVRITVGASDNRDLKEIILFIDGARVFSVNDKLLEYVWDTRPIADNRDHNIHATASDEEDNIGFSGSITVRVVAGNLPDTLAPVISILHPVSGSNVSDTVQVVPQIFDDSPIEKVDYYVDGNLAFTTEEEPYKFPWNVNNLVNGSSHSLFARAFDVNLNNAVSNVVRVTIQNTDFIPPTLSILYPSQGTVFSSGESVTIRVDAQDNVGIQRVEFYIDGTRESTDTAAPYQYEWDTTEFGDGRSHTIYVKAFDFTGNSGTQIITVTVNP